MYCFTCFARWVKQFLFFTLQLYYSFSVPSFSFPQLHLVHPVFSWPFTHQWTMCLTYMPISLASIFVIAVSYRSHTYDFLFNFFNGKFSIYFSDLFLIFSKNSSVKFWQNSENEMLQKYLKFRIVEQRLYFLWKGVKRTGFNNYL